MPELNQHTKTLVSELMHSMQALFPEVLGIDEIIPGNRVTNLDPYGEGLATYPRYIQVALRGRYHQDAYYLSDSGLGVGSNCIVMHLREGNLYIIMGSGGTSGGTKTFLVQAIGGTNGSCLTRCDPRGIQFADNEELYAYGAFLIPADYSSDIKVKAVVIPAATGNAFVQNQLDYGACGEGSQTHTDSIGPAAVAITNSDLNCIQEITMASPTAGDIVRCEFWRDGSDVLDTINNFVYVLGWIVEYQSAY